MPEPRPGGPKPPKPGKRYLDALRRRRIWTITCRQLTELLNAEPTREGVQALIDHWDAEAPYWKAVVENGRVVRRESKPQRDPALWLVQLQDTVRCVRALQQVAAALVDDPPELLLRVRDVMSLESLLHRQPTLVNLRCMYPEGRPAGWCWLQVGIRPHSTTDETFHAYDMTLAEVADVFFRHILYEGNGGLCRLRRCAGLAPGVEVVKNRKSFCGKLIAYQWRPNAPRYCRYPPAECKARTERWVRRMRHRWRQSTEHEVPREAKQAAYEQLRRFYAIRYRRFGVPPPKEFPREFP
jgi:hypothetical protein